MTLLNKFISTVLCSSYRYTVIEEFDYDFALNQIEIKIFYHVFDSILFHFRFWNMNQMHIILLSAKEEENAKGRIFLV